MIVKMKKYSFVVLSSKRDEFLGRLQELGLVDVTTTGWEPSEADRRVMLDVERYKGAVAKLRAMASQPEFQAGKPFANGDEAFDRYVAAEEATQNLQGEIARLRKLAEEAQAWGEFDASLIERLRAEGVVVHLFTAQSSDYKRNLAQWSENYTVELINDQAGTACFVVVTGPDDEVMIDAQELKPFSMTASEAMAEVAKLESEVESWNSVYASCVASLDMIEQTQGQIVGQLDFSRVARSGRSEAEGALTLMEAWAEEASEKVVDAMLDAEPGLYYIKENPTPEDDTPVKLKNGWFARVFELIGSMYALPKYGTIDLTPLFAPFYMLFFAICLNDAGYGAIILALGLALLAKGGPKMRQASWLSILCGGATVLFGTYSGSLFGMSIPELLGYPSVADSPFLDFQGQFFSIALALGVVQILLGMAVNIYMTIRTFGFMHALGLIGWFMLIVSGCLAMALPMLNEAWVIPGFTTSSIAFYVAVGISLVLMLLLNKPRWNIFANFASGLWDTYNNITGLLSDVLSYIRLFAIGLSGGVLALVFNNLAMGLTGVSEGIGDGSIVGFIGKVIGAAIILIIGHGINLFMSTISSFVHPMRLTFVEFFKNAGFEMTTRTFEPFKKQDKKQ